jgi:hypothetical protein
MIDYEAADGLLIEATKKLLSLRQQDDWAKELPRRTPPILWFGNARSQKPKVLTIGANPSRWEYLDDSCRPDLIRFQGSGDELLLSYLEPPKHRFRVLDTARESLEGIWADSRIRNEIIQGYDNYFCNNPYRKWFGHPKEQSYNVEGFLRGLGASYYDTETTPYQAIHIDLLPFATLSNFNKLEHMTATLFSSGWAKQFVASLVRLFQPTLLVAFGRANVKHLATHIDPSISSLPWTRYEYEETSYRIGEAEQLGVNIVGLSVNLGNPRPFNSADLRKFGSYVGTLLGFGQQGQVPMTDTEKARLRFQKAGLAFPTIPEEFAPGLKEREEWLYSTREIEVSPYDLDHYVHEITRTRVEDYAVLSYSGHGVNSYAIQYYLVHGALRMFLHLGWGGVYSDAKADAAEIRDCFSLADEIVAATQTVGKLRPGERLLVVGSDFYGSYWLPPGNSDRGKREDSKTPASVLAEALSWLTNPGRQRG